MTAKKKLGKKERQELEKLEERGKTEGCISAELFLEEEMNAIADVNCYFYEKEGTGYTGFLSMFLPDETKAELTVALFGNEPEKRRDLFERLVLAACTECEPLGVKEIRLVTDPKNKFLEGLPKLPLAVSEYMLAVATEKLAETAGKRVKARKEERNAKGTIGGSREFVGYEEDGEWEYILWENEDALCSCRIIRFGAEEAYLYGLLTREEMRRCGIATEFLAELAETLVADGCQTLKLQVYSENHPAMELYRGLGFWVDEQRDYYAVDVLLK